MVESEYIAAMLFFCAGYINSITGGIYLRAGRTALAATSFLMAIACAALGFSCLVYS